MSELLNGVKLKFELPFKIPTPVSFPFESIGTFRPITRIPKYDYSLEKTIVKEIAKRKQEDQYDQLRQAQQQLSMVDLIASRKSRHKGKEPDRNSTTFGTSSESNVLVRPSSESGVTRPAKSKAADIAASSEQLSASLSASNRNDLSSNAAVQKSGAAVAEMKAPSQQQMFTPQPMMQTGSPLMKDSGHQGPGQPFLGMTSMMQPQQNTVAPPNDLRFNNRFSSSFGTSPAVANSSTPSSTSIPALPPKPDGLKPYAHKASGSPTSHKPQPAATPSVPSTGPARPQFKYGYGPIVPPPLPKRRNDTQGQQPPALPPKPFASFSEFDYTTDGPGALGSGSQTEHVEQLNTLLSMGFSRPHAIHALEMHDYDVNMASNYLIDKSSS
ncbi:hypothetical protein LPJ72_000403 [Coemansia sp. Benny D160-2]|nr:hypothetical protein LPJ72_000403 [Coemansia sp. Benny D160-2]